MITMPMPMMPTMLYRFTRKYAECTMTGQRLCGSASTPAAIETMPSITVSARSELTQAEPPRTTMLSTHLLGEFRLRINGRPMEGKLKGRRRSLMKFLLARRRQPTPREMLMDVFWPDAEPEAARNNLNVAMYNLRQTLRTATEAPIIVYEDGIYSFNPEIHVWVNAEQFEQEVKVGRQLEAMGQVHEAVAVYERAINLYEGDFLCDDPYAEWALFTRERLRLLYMDTLDRLSEVYYGQQQYEACINTCHLLLASDNCREDAHRRLMRCYVQQKRTPLAIRQYQVCLNALRAELDVEPDAITTTLYEQIRRHALD